MKKLLFLTIFSGNPRPNICRWLRLRNNQRYAHDEPRTDRANGKRPHDSRRRGHTPRNSACRPKHNRHDESGIRATIVRAIVAPQGKQCRQYERTGHSGPDHENRGYVRQSRAACRTLRHKLAWGRCANRGKSQQGSSRPQCARSTLNTATARARSQWSICSAFWMMSIRRNRKPLIPCFPEHHSYGGTSITGP